MNKPNVEEKMPAEQVPTITEEFVSAASKPIVVEVNSYDDVRCREIRFDNGITVAISIPIALISKS